MTSEVPNDRNAARESLASLANLTTLSPGRRGRLTRNG
jgi:hypothetical protein